MNGRRFIKTTMNKNRITFLPLAVLLTAGIFNHGLL
jgi:hypothetical protein